MNILKFTSIVLVFGFMMTFGYEIGESLKIPGAQHLVPTVEAVVGRPLTPVSVAGVARRTTRRCAAGVYNCSLPQPQPVDNFITQTSSEPMSLKKDQATSS
jgi:hypothetical protein